VSLKQHIKIAKRNTKITPKLHAWLNNNDGVRVEDEVTAKRVLDILAPSEHDRSGVFHPSQLYQCPRLQVFEYYGVDKREQYNPTLRNLFNDGHFRHLRWQIMLLNAGILTDIEVKVSIPEYRLAGSMDGVNTDEGWMFELKGTSQYQSVVSRGAMPAHIKQVNAYLMASGLDQALIVYEDKLSQQWQEIEVSKDPKIVDEIESILQDLNRAIETGELPEILDECKDQEGARFNRCPYGGVCHKLRNRDDIIEALPPERRVAIPS
jgi:hypothetical protein